jgi:cell division protease FtsH
MNLRKIKLFIRFHWIMILILCVAILVGTSLVIFLRNAVIAWGDSEYYTKRAILAQLSVFFYIFFVLHIISAPLHGFMSMWILRGGAARMTQLHKKAVKGKEIRIGWSDVVGMEEAKQEAMEVVNLITDRAQLRKIGGQILRGVLMIGPPGCGKTYLAKAIATESNLPFISMSGSEFTEMFVGVGASRVRKLFKQARQLAYSEGGCIVFLDEIDAVAAQRTTDAGFGGQTERNTTVNQLLVEMDGLKAKDQNIVLIGATNAPEGFLDQALLRPGRFDRKIYVGLPNLEEREKIFTYYLKEITYDPSLDTKRLARLTVRKSPADIANLVREAALIALRNKKERVEMREITEALDRTELGIKHRIIFNEEERKKVAYHEAGHIIATYFYQPSQDVFKASISARGSSLGVVIPHPKEEMHIHTKEYYLGMIKSNIGSYVAEKLIFNTTTSGVSQDFTSAMIFAHKMVWNWGMGKSGLVGNYEVLGSMQSGGGAFRGSPSSLLSEEIKTRLNNETQDILQECLKDVEELLKRETGLLHKFAQELLEKEELDYDQIEAVFKEFGKSRPAA